MQSVIYGFTGSGKTTYLKGLKTESSKIDLDEYILKRNPIYSSLIELINEEGEKWFRCEEYKCLEMILDENKDVYIALGGGSVTEEVISLLVSRSVKGIYKKLSFEACWQRIKADKERLIVAYGKKYCEDLYQKRERLFEKLLGELNESIIIGHKF